MVKRSVRINPVVAELKRLVSRISERPRGVHAIMVDPDGEPDDEDQASLELRHLFELVGIVDALFGVEPETAIARRRGALTHVSLRYPGPTNAFLRIGRKGRRRRHEVHVIYPDRRFSADLIDDAITMSTRNNQVHKSFFPVEPATPGAESGAVAAAADGERVERVASALRPKAAPMRARVAIIGGGVFGATCALELAATAEVTLFERRAELLTETSFTNQRRHHSGFHYPRSYDSIVEIQAARALFEDAYGDAIDRGFPSYYCTSATGIEIPAERYLAACRSNQLSFTIVDPPEGVVDPAAVSLCLATDEAVYDMVRLRQIVSERLARSPSVRCRLQTDVVAGAIANDGSKRLTVSGPDGTREESFDYLVNATYAGRNMVAQWFGFPTDPLRFDLYELLLFRLPIPQICATILDGPFTSLTGTGRENLFLLSHIHQSVSRSVIPDDGRPPQWSGIVSNRANMFRHSEPYLPIVRQASDVQSWWVTRAVDAFARDFDARPTVVTDHGFGCWSVLGGKIVTTVANAREIATEIRAEQQGGASDSTRPMHG